MGTHRSAHPPKLLPVSVSLSQVCLAVLYYTSVQTVDTPWAEVPKGIQPTFSYRRTFGFLWWGKNITRKSELMLESRDLTGWIHLVRMQHISDVGCGNLFNILKRKWLSSHPRGVSELSPFAVHRWRKLRTQVATLPKVIEQDSSRPWVWAPT